MVYKNSGLKKKNKFFCILFLILSFCISGTFAKEISINRNWKFYKGDIQGAPDNIPGQLSWEEVHLPHTWNTHDVLDDKQGYYRGVGWYKKTIFLDADHADKSLFIHFHGANQVAEVYVNGQEVGNHIGGYTGFRFQIDEQVNIYNDKNKTPNIILVKVDNSHNENIPPLSADFTFYGGIYRQVMFIEKEKIHFDLSDYASSGIYITTPEVNKESAEVKIKGAIVKDDVGKERIKVVNTLIDDNGNKIAEEISNHECSQNRDVNFEHDFKQIKDFRLWSPEKPCLYKVISKIYDYETGELLDETINPLAFRFFSFDPDKGFFLNGEPYKLRGVCRHQDYQYLGNALSEEIHVRDIRLMKEAGFNFLRIAHYPQSRSILEACDRLGIITSVEIPIVNRITETEAFSENCRYMLLDMIKQNFNHPSIIMWAYMNEVLLRPKFKDDPERQKTYFENIFQLASELEKITRDTDPYRYTMMANHAAFDRYHQVGLTQIPMLVGWNLYPGWYGSDLNRFGRFLDMHHEKLPDKPLLVSEYGAGADPRLRSFTPKRFDFSVEYSVKYHQHYLEAMNERPFVAASMVWNFADFGSESRIDAVPHVNNKGILTWKREPKDMYFLYQAYLLDEPVLKIGAGNWKLRSGIEDTPGKGTCSQPLQIFTNLEQATLFINGQKMGSKHPGQLKHTIEWEKVPFRNGENIIEVVGKEKGEKVKDVSKVDFKLIPANLKSDILPFEDINISLGDERIMVDEQRDIVWLPGKPYRDGSWGYIGGETFVMKNTRRQAFGTEKSISDTKYDPMYQTQVVGIEKFKFDVPAGYYELDLHFAELLSGEEMKSLAYNLDDEAAKKGKSAKRAFRIFINNEISIPEISSEHQLEPTKACSFSTRVFVERADGITIEFDQLRGKSILNGIQLRKIY